MEKGVDVTVEDAEGRTPFLIAGSAECIEAYCARQQKKIDLLLAEAKTMREAEAAGGSSKKVRWTDIDGNDANDAAWLKE